MSENDFYNVVVSQFAKEDLNEIIQGLYRIVYEIREKDVVIHTLIDSRRNFDEVLIAKLMRYIKK